MASLDRRSLKTGVKMGMGFTDFARKYDLEQEELESKIRFFYKNNKEDAEDIIKALAKNEKRHSKEVTEYKGVPIETFKTMSMEEFLKFEKESEKPQKSRVEMEVADLEKEILDLSNRVISKESEHKKWHERHRGHLMQISTLDEKLSKIESELKEIKKKYDSIVGLDNDAVERANLALEEKHQLEAAIEEKRLQLKKLKVVTICAYADGSISPLDDSVDIILDDSGHEELFTKLINLDECQELKAKEIKTLARLIKITEHSPCDLEIASDNAEIEKAFSSLIAEK